MNRVTLLLLGLLLPMSACADGEAPELPQKVNLDDVVRTGGIHPVVGITPEDFRGTEFRLRSE